MQGTSSEGRSQSNVEGVTTRFQKLGLELDCKMMERIERIPDVDKKDIRKIQTFTIKSLTQLNVQY